METTCVSSNSSEATTVTATSSSSSSATTTSPSSGNATTTSSSNVSTVETAVVGLREGEHLDCSLEDTREVQAVDEFMNQGCTCHLGVQGSPCSKQLTRETIESTWQDCLDLTKSELDLVVLSQIHFLQSTAQQPIYSGSISLLCWK